MGIWPTSYKNIISCGLYGKYIYKNVVPLEKRKRYQAEREFGGTK